MLVKCGWVLLVILALFVKSFVMASREGPIMWVQSCSKAECFRVNCWDPLSTLSRVMFSQVWICLRKLWNWLQVQTTASLARCAERRGCCVTVNPVWDVRENPEQPRGQRKEDSGGGGGGRRFLPVEFLSQLSGLGHITEVPNVCALAKAAAQLAPEFTRVRVCSLCKYAQMASADFSYFSLVVIFVGF